MKKIALYGKEHLKEIILIIGMIAINYFALRSLQQSSGTNTSHSYSFMITLVTIILQIILYTIILVAHKKKWKVENIFLFLAVTFGLLYMVFIPVGRVPDEQNHFLRAYEISKGHLVSDKSADGVGGRTLTNDVSEIFKANKEYINYEDVMKHLSVKKSTEESFMAFPNMSLYSFVCYIPQTTGILIGRILHLPTLWIAYLGRLFNLATWIAIMYFTIKHIPFKKLVVLSFAFLPMSLQEACSLSADALTNAIAFALIGFVFYMKYTKKEVMNKKEFITMCLLAIIMSMCKIVYLPICLVLFLIPKERFHSNKDKYKKIILLAVAVIVLNLVWLAISSSYLIEFRTGVDPANQVKYILSNPIDYIQILFNTLYDRITLYVFNIVGFSLCYFDVNLSYLYIYLYLILGTYLMIMDADDRIDAKDKGMMLFVIISCILLMFTSLYVQWTAVGETIIDGVQGRYFIPLLIPLAVLCNNKIKTKLSMSNLGKYAELLIVFINVYAIMVIFFKHI